MKKSPELIGDKILILGYGREGTSVHRYLINNYPNATIAIADAKHIVPIAPVEQQYHGPHYLAHAQEYSTLIRSPGVPIHRKELQNYLLDGGHMTTATNIFFSLCQGQTIGITGTKGKSTTASLIAHILQTWVTRAGGPPKPGLPFVGGFGGKPAAGPAQKSVDVRLVGNIGNPALDQLSGSTNKTIFVIELSSHMLEDIRYSPHIAVILNITQEHLDYYPTFNHYTAAKAHIVAYQTKDDFVVYNPNHPLPTKIAQVSLGQKITFSLKDKNLLPSDLLLKGKGNRENCLAAMAVGSLFNIPPAILRSCILTFKPLPHRMEFLGEVRGIRFYNDSLATTPEAVIHALEALGQDVATLIAGGFDRGLDYTNLGIYLSGLKSLKSLILFPETGIKIWKAYQKAGGENLQKFDVGSMDEAVKIAFQHTSQGKICLLSPGAASFNLFKDYADRGEQFAKAVFLAK